MILNKFFKWFIVLVVTIVAVPVTSVDVLAVWGYECKNNKCIKTQLNGDNNGQSLTLCKMICGDEIGTLWPQPTGLVKTSRQVVDIDYKKIKFNFPLSPTVKSLWKLVKSRFRSNVAAKIPDSDILPSGGTPLVVKVLLDQNAEEEDEMPRLTYDTDESYNLKITRDDDNGKILAEINARTFFGARHGLETLLQVIVYDEIRGNMQILVETEINDGPIYKHRGVLLDTARNYFSVKSIKRTIDGMAMSKLNVFHWHMIDSNSFPFVVKSHPDLHNLGAYSSRKVYTPQDIADILEFARSRGVRVIPEFDGPAHVGEGWQNTNMTVCFNAQPWKNFCSEPPCGQLNPTIDAMYDILEDIYREMFEAFDEPDIFHMGADTVSSSCWNSSANIRNWMHSKGWALDENDFTKLWGHFQTKALARLDKVSKDKRLPIIVWAGRLTEVPFIDEFIDKSRYIIQTFQSKPDQRTTAFLNRGIRMISTNIDLFIGSSTATWNRGEGEIGGWQKIYENRPDEVFGGANKLILGSEVAVWAEVIDEFSLDTLLWPKASGLGERLWSNPRGNWAAAESRFVVHRDRLTENGIRAEALQPEWCVQNQNECPRDAYE